MRTECYNTRNTGSLVMIFTISLVTKDSRVIAWYLAIIFMSAEHAVSPSDKGQALRVKLLKKCELTMSSYLCKERIFEAFITFFFFHRM